jgi:hypothetical protein
MDASITAAVIAPYLNVAAPLASTRCIPLLLIAKNPLFLREKMQK